MFEYQVMDEQQAMNERFELMKEGEYEAIIIASEDTVSANSGNPMMSMILSVFDDAGRAHSVKDYLVFTPKMMWKVIHCAKSAGLEKEYGAQKFCSDIIMDKRVRVKIVVKEGGIIPEDKLKDRPLGSRYPAQNSVYDYLECSNQGKVSNAVQNTRNPVADDELDDDVPF